MSLHSNAVSHWLGANLESSLHISNYDFALETEIVPEIASMVKCDKTLHEEEQYNRQISQCIKQIPPNVTFYKMVHCGIYDWCIAWSVRWIYCLSAVISQGCLIMMRNACMKYKNNFVYLPKLLLVTFLLAYSPHPFNTWKWANQNNVVDIWGLCCQKQVSQAGISNYIPQ